MMRAAHHSYTRDRRRIVELLEARGGASIRDICDALGRDYDATRKLLLYMLRDGLVTYRRTWPRRFKATPSASSSRYLAPRPREDD